MPEMVTRHAVPLALALALAAAMLAVVRVGLEPPAPRGTSAPAAEFSAARARATLAEIATGRAEVAADVAIAPRPTGSAAAVATAGRIRARFAALGLPVRIESSFVCGWGNVCAAVRNVVAELPGRSTRAVLLTAHYDSVAAGPGVADDLAGVAAMLEVARALVRSPPAEHGVVFLAADGEEIGSLGAEAFAARSPLADRIAGVVSVEARGTSGPSLLFETAGRSSRSVPRFAAFARCPVGSSVLVWAYGLLPNFTDFSVFARKGLSGLNFAFIGDPARYHTARDDLSSLSLASLEHQGENALAAVRALANDDRLGDEFASAVFFDLYGRALVSWPARWCLPLAIAGLAGLFAATAFAVRRRRVRALDVARGFAVVAGVPLATAALGFALDRLLRLALGPTADFPLAPVAATALEAGFWLLAAGLVVALSPGFRAGVDRPGADASVSNGGAWPTGPALSVLLGVSLGVSLGWLAAAVALSALAPTASYPLLVPALVAALLAPLALSRRPWLARAAALAPGLVAGALWFPLALLVDVGFGFAGHFLVAALVALSLTWLAPLAAAAGRGRRRMAGTLLGLAAVALVGFMFAAKSTGAAPRPINVIVQEDADARRAEWIVQGAPPLPREMAVLATGPFERRLPTGPWPGIGLSFHAAAPAAGLAPPELDLVDSTPVSEGRRLKLRLRSPRGASYAAFLVPNSAGLSELTIGGESAPRRPDGRFMERDGYRPFQVHGLPPEGVELVATVAAAPARWWILDRTPGLTGGAARLAAARPPSTVPMGIGDFTQVSRIVER